MWQFEQFTLIQGQDHLEVLENRIYDISHILEAKTIFWKVAIGMWVYCRAAILLMLVF